MDRLETDILIAGGGVAGLAALNIFGAAGFSCICVDLAPLITDGTADGADLRSTAFLRPAIELFQEAGLWDEMSRNATDLKVMRLLDAGGRENGVRESADFTAAEIGHDSFGSNLPNWQIRKTLVGHAGKMDWARLIAPARITRITTRLNEVIVRLSTGQQIRARLLIGADGRNSFVREASGIPVRRWDYGQKALVFTVSHPQPHENVSTELHRTGGPFTLVPLPGDNSAVVWMDRGPEIATLLVLDDAAFSGAATERSCSVLGPLKLTSKRVAWPIISQLAGRMDAHRTALVAEAAHVVPPIGAQGLNMSLADLACLRDLVGEARNKGEDIGSATLLSRYHRKRHAEVSARVLGVDMLNRAALAQNQSLRDLRRRGLHLLSGPGPVKQTAMRVGLG